MSINDRVRRAERALTRSAASGKILKTVLTSDERRTRLAALLFKACGRGREATPTVVQEFIGSGGLCVLDDAEHWRRWGAYAKARGDTQRVGIFAELARTADAVAERRSWRQGFARDAEADGDADRAARLRAMDAAERAAEEPKRAAARAALALPGDTEPAGQAG